MSDYKLKDVEGLEAALMKMIGMRMPGEKINKVVDECSNEVLAGALTEMGANQALIDPMFTWSAAFDLEVPGDPLKDYARVLMEAGERLRRVWIKVEDRLPDTTRKVLVRYHNSHDMQRTVMAQYIKRFTLEAVDDPSDHRILNSEYCEERDVSYIIEGWYECIDNWDEYSSIFINEGVVTEWMELPK